MSEFVVCPDGRTRRKIYHLWTEQDDELKAVCGMEAFGDNTVTPRVLGASNPHCFTGDWLKVSCPQCMDLMRRGIVT